MARVLETAVKLLDRGYRPVILWPPAICRPKLKRVSSGKEGFGYGWGSKEISGETLAADYRAAKAQGGEPGVGICLGPGRAPGGRWLIDVEGDGPEAEASRAKLFGGEVVSTIGWESTRGRHDLFAADGERLRTILAGLSRFQVKKENQPGVYNFVGLPGLELRIGGYTKAGAVKQLQSAAPPTPGTDGVPRAWHECGVLADLPEVAYEFLISQADDPVRLYLRTALRNAVARIEAAQPGSRRNTYRDEAYCLSGYLHYGIYTEDELFRALTAAKAVGVGDDDPVVIETVADAIAAGKGAPRNLKDELHAAHEANGRATGGEGKKGRARAQPSANGDEQADDRPIILVTTQVHEVVDAAVAALAPDPEIFQRANSLVRIVRDTAPARGILRPDDSPQIRPIPAPIIRKFLTQDARWYVSKGEDRKPKPVIPPSWAVGAVEAQGSWPEIRYIEAVVEVPQLRADGTILDTPGYDPQTGLVYEPNSDYPPIPIHPTLEEARSAAGMILNLVTDFPFCILSSGSGDGEGDDGLTHRAAWLSALLTPLARFAIAGPCPLFLIDANTPGTGKSLLADLVAVVATGRTMPRTAYPDNDEEMRKRITSIALNGDLLMLIDNITSTFGGPALDAALTGTTWRDRTLGRNEMTPALPIYVVWFATGNNVHLKGDVVRRIAFIRLETDEEKPEERRDFAVQEPLLRYTERNRPALVAAGLTILRAYLAAGKPDQGLTPLGSYEAWSEVVRSAVHWCLGVDPCTTRRGLIESDPEHQARIALIEGWAELPDSESGLTAAFVLELLKENPNRFETLRGVLQGWTRSGDLPTARSVGMRLNAIRGRVIGNKVFRSREAGRGILAWRVEVVARGTSGISGTNFGYPARRYTVQTYSRDCKILHTEEEAEQM